MFLFFFRAEFSWIFWGGVSFLSEQLVVVDLTELFFFSRYLSRSENTKVSRAVTANKTKLILSLLKQQTNNN